MSVPLPLQWMHGGNSYRVTPWPESRIERRYGDEWLVAVPGEEVLASAAARFGPREWQAYLEFLPRGFRELLVRYSHGRLQALLILANCSDLCGTLEETPALVPFIASEVRQRTQPECWGEISAIFERNGVYGLLEWLGLPSSPQTLAVLQNLAEPDIPLRQIEHLRSLLWEPRALFVLQRLPLITDRHLHRFSNALAA